ncbi:MAG: type II secretion system protein [Planctomycetota bacterium]|nr:type II secretion system protein [Planctomycetota bacterium]
MSKRGSHCLGVHEDAGAGHHDRCNAAHRAAFSLIDVLVSISVIAILLAILAPSLSGVIESARRVSCQSIMRQVGLGLIMWADDNNGNLPASVFAEIDPLGEEPQNMMLLHLGEQDPTNWDGLGFLVRDEYLTAWPVFYCPSHRGNHPINRYEDSWSMLGAELVANYQYRTLPYDQLALSQLPKDFTLLSDGLRTQLDYNHQVGANTLKADLSVMWYDDQARYVVSQLPTTDGDKHFGLNTQYGPWASLDEGEPVLPPSTPGIDDPDASMVLGGAYGMTSRD